MKMIILGCQSHNLSLTRNKKDCFGIYQNFNLKFNWLLRIEQIVDKWLLNTPTSMQGLKAVYLIKSNRYMSTVELRRLLIEKIKTTENKELLQEVYRLLDLEERDIVKYDLSDVQRNAINEAKEQIKTGRFLTNDQADNEIDEWLNK